MKMKYADGGEVEKQRNKEIAQTILQQLGGGNRLAMMVGAYNFVIIPNGVAFRIKNAKANVIKITLNGLDLYDLEVGRMRGTTYKVVVKHDNIYNDMLKPLIEKATGMYLSLYKKGGKMEKMAKGGKTENKNVAVSKTISGDEINEFIDYCYKFYGKGGIYANDLKGGLTKAQVKTAVIKYLDELDSTPTWGGGDSLDRERVRLIFDKNYSLLKKGGKMAKGGGVKSESEVWNDWSVEQRKHFLKDHRVFTNKAQDHRASLYRFDELPIDLVNSIKSILKEHISEVQYAKGGKMAKGGNTDDTPKIYVADLHAYNDGKLIGEWLDLSDYEDGEEVMEAIQKIVDKWKAKYGEEHEEFAIHDFENFSRDLYSEYMSEDSFDKVVKIYKISKERGIPQEVLGSIAREYNVDGDDLEDWIDDHYEGQFDSDEDLAYNYVEMVGGVNELDKKTLENYFDYKSFGRDLAYDYTEFDGYYFRSYKRGGNIDKKYDLMKYLKMDSSGWNYSIGGL